MTPQSVLASLYHNDESDEDEDVDHDDRDGTMRKAEHAAKDLRHPSQVLSSRGSTPSRHSSNSRSQNIYGVETSHSSKEGQGNGKLNMALGLVRRTVTVLVFNIFGLHAFAKQHAVEELQRMHSTLLESFSTLVAQGKGVVDSFQGDRFVATFNAVIPNAQHATRAAVAAMEIMSAFAKNKGNLRRASIGIATGEALVGNAGTVSQRRFCTIGRVYTQATIMERLVKEHDAADVLLTHSSALAVAHDFYTEVLDCVRLEGGAKPTLVHALRTRKSHAMEEWNYAMAQSEATDIYSRANDAWLKYLDGDNLSAQSMLSDAPEGHAGASNLKSVLATGASAVDHALTAQGRFFGAAFSS